MAASTSSNWFVFGVRGISISGPLPPSNEWEWQDARITSVDGIRSLLSQYGIRDEIGNGKSKIDLVDMMMTGGRSIVTKEKVDSVVMVRRYGRPREAEGGHEPACPIAHSASRRADEVIAALSIALSTFVDTSLIQTVVPWSRRGQNWAVSSCVRIPDGDWHGGIRNSGSTYAHNPTLSMTLPELMSRLSECRFRELTRVLLDEKNRNRLGCAIADAGIILARAMYDDFSSSKVLGSVTAGEVIAADSQQAKFDDICQRLAALCPTNTARGEWSQVFSSRNAFVHKGIEPSTSAGVHAVLLAMQTLDYAAHLSHHIDGRDDLHRLLDLWIATARAKESPQLAALLDHAASQGLPIPDNAKRASVSS